jgi:hypothetical protein
MEEYDNSPSQISLAARPTRRRTDVQSGTQGLRGMLKDVRGRGLSHDEARAVAELMQTIRRLLPDEDL